MNDSALVIGHMRPMLIRRFHAAVLACIVLSACSESHVVVGSDAGWSRDGGWVAEDATVPIDGGASNACEGSVSFGDSTLEAAVRLALGIGEARPIDGVEMLALTTLSVQAESGPVGSLVGLECAKNLTELALSGGGTVSDLSPLAGLDELIVLWIVGHEIVSLEPLRGLVALRHINLGDNQIVDVSPIADLQHVSILDLWGNQIRDIDPLRDPSWIEPGPCMTRVNFYGNPLDGSSLNKTIPALCDYADTVWSAEVWIEWTDGSCHNSVICDIL